MGMKKPSPTSLAHLKRMWAGSIAVGMMTEVCAILMSRVAYVCFRPHRFVFNLGYGFDATDPMMTSPALLLTAMFLELFFECIVDFMAVSVESEEGVDVDEFWKMFHTNPAAYWGLFVMNNVIAFLLTLWAFVSVERRKTPPDSQKK